MVIFNLYANSLGNIVRPFLSANTEVSISTHTPHTHTFFTIC